MEHRNILPGAGQFREEEFIVFMEISVKLDPKESMKNS